MSQNTFEWKISIFMHLFDMVSGGPFTIWNRITPVVLKYIIHIINVISNKLEQS